MIPDLPDGCSIEQEMDFYSNLLELNQDQGSIHMKWYTHSHNPSLCWICDRATLCLKMVQLNDRLLSKSTVDSETDNVQEKDSDSEIESDYNEPEFEIEDVLPEEET